MGFGLFAVEAVRNIAIVMFRQRNCRGGRNRDTLIRRTKQQVEINPGIHKCFGVKTA
ncbi:hypothetical protein D3C87_2039380 [compost metagenome]